MEPLVNRQPQYRFLFHNSTRSFDVYRAPSTWWERLRAGAPQLGREDYNRLSVLLQGGRSSEAQTFLEPLGLYAVLGQVNGGQ